MKGSARAVTEESPVLKRSKIARRVGSARAPNVVSNAASSYLTMWLNILSNWAHVKPRGEYQENLDFPVA